jgi:predicted MFS family arabinose efflux permease
VWAVLRFMGGLSAAAGMLLGTGLILNWLIRHNHRSELGIHFSGIGLGIAGCAALVAFVTQGLNWREQWFAFAAVGALLMIPALRWVPRPDASGLTTTGQKMEDRPPSARYLQIFIAAYFCAGIAYVIGATFIVAIVNKLPGLTGQGNLAFLAIGIGAAPACIIWDFVARRTGDLNALILAAVLQIVGILLPLLAGGLVMTIVGTLLFGATFVGMVSLVMTMAGRYYPNQPAKMMGKMSMSYGAGQIVGPAATGALAAHFGSYEVGLYLAAGMMLLGTCLLLALRSLETGATARPAEEEDRLHAKAHHSGRP